MTTREDDALQHMLFADTHDQLLFFTDRGRVYRVRCFQIPADTSRTSRGTPGMNLLSLSQGERINAVLAIPTLDMDGKFVMATRKGEVKALRLRALANMRSNGLIFMDLEKGDEMVSVRNLEEDDDVLIVTASGQSICFPGKQAPLRSRPAGGVRGIRLVGNDVVVGMEAVKPKDRVLVISAQGSGKLMSMARYPRQRRGGKGVRAFKVTDRTGPLSDARVVTEGVEDEVVLVSAQCQVYRTSLQGISTQGRNASGVKVWRPDEGDEVASIACFQNNHRSPE